MGLKSRLGKLERRHSTADLDLTKLSDDELDAGFRKCIEQLGIDWGSFQNDPKGAFEKAVEGVEDDEGIIAEFLKAIVESNIDWSTGGCSPSAGW